MANLSGTRKDAAANDVHERTMAHPEQLYQVDQVGISAFLVDGKVKPLVQPKIGLDILQRDLVLTWRLAFLCA